MSTLLEPIATLAEDDYDPGFGDPQVLEAVAPEPRGDLEARTCTHCGRTFTPQERPRNAYRVMGSYQGVDDLQPYAGYYDTRMCPTCWDKWADRCRVIYRSHPVLGRCPQCGSDGAHLLGCWLSRVDDDRYLEGLARRA